MGDTERTTAQVMHKRAGLSISSDQKRYVCSLCRSYGHETQRSDMHAALQVQRKAVIICSGNARKLSSRLPNESRFCRWFTTSCPRHMPRQLLRDRWSSMVVGAKGSRALQELMQEREDEKNEQLPLATKIEWESPLAVVQYPDPRLRAVNARVGVFDDSLRQLAEEMFEVMYQDDGVGLAAPQVGVNLRLMVFNESGDRDRRDKEMVLVNPTILQSGGSSEVFEEGCLSFPQIYADVWRPAKIKVKAQSLSGKKMTFSLSGFPARIFQHEYDHLQGTLFHDRMEAPVLEGVRGQLVAMEEAYLAQHPGADIRRV